MKTGYAGFLIRLAAGVVDVVFLGIMSGIIFLPLKSFFTPDLGNIRFILVNLVMVLGWFYFSIFESSRLQGTVGKYLLGLTVVDRNNERIGFGRATGRYLGILISAALYGFGFIMPLWTKEKRALADFIAGTLLVHRGTKNADIGIDVPLTEEEAVLDAKIKIIMRMRESGEMNEEEYQIALKKIRS